MLCKLFHAGKKLFQVSKKNHFFSHFDFLFLIGLIHIIYVKKIFFEIKQAGIFLMRSFFSILNNGVTCIVCGENSFVYPICKKCLSKHFSIEEVLNERRCKVCGKVLISTDDTCSRCRDEKILVHTDNVLPLFSYRLWNKELLYKWKIMGERSVSSLFAYFVYKALDKLNDDIVVTVPPRKGKIQKNGWDQVDEICSFLKNRYGIKVLKLLKRNTTEQQKKLHKKERLETISCAYQIELEKVIKQELKCVNNVLPKKVCLIDDVCTTGATIESCAKILKNIGIEIVDVITLFIVD